MYKSKNIFFKKNLKKYFYVSLNKKYEKHAQKTFEKSSF